MLTFMSRTQEPLMHRRLIYMTGALLALSGALQAQTQAALTGQVSDPSGAVVVGAAVTATRTDTGRQYPTRTNEAGIYSLPFLPPGPYIVQCEMAGFEKISR